LITNQF